MEPAGQPEVARFNPTLVRLRRVSVAPDAGADLLGFNPTLVRLRRPWGSGRPGGSSWCFNPTLVRLRHANKILQAYRLLTFQSHAGSIEARRIRKMLGG